MARCPQPIPAFRQTRVCDCGEHAFVGLTKGRVALVDASDAPRIAGRLWCFHARDYAAAKIDGALVTMHSFLLGPSNLHTDHISGDGLDNRRGNLRRCEAKENLRNRRKHKTTALPFKGVWMWAPGRFRGHIRVDGRLHHLGSFPTPEAAARAYDAAAIEHFGEFARTNVDLGLLPPLAAE